MAELAQTILDESDPNKAKGMVDQFNWNIAKKNLLRLLKLSGLYDAISDEVLNRFERNPNNFTNDELLDFLNTIQNAMEKASKAMKGAEEPQYIQIKQDNNIHVNILDSFDRDSKERITDAIKSILAQASSVPPVYETSYEQINDEKDE